MIGFIKVFAAIGAWIAPLSIYSFYRQTIQGIGYAPLHIVLFCLVLTGLCWATSMLIAGQVWTAKQHLANTLSKGIWLVYVLLVITTFGYLFFLAIEPWI